MKTMSNTKQALSVTAKSSADLFLAGAKKSTSAPLEDVPASLKEKIETITVVCSQSGHKYLQVALKNGSYLNASLHWSLLGIAECGDQLKLDNRLQWSVTKSGANTYFAFCGRLK